MENLHLISILLLAVSTSLDNLGVGIAYGLRRQCIPFVYNVLIALINSIGTIVSMSIGERLYIYMQPETAGYIGSALFISAGSWLIIKLFYAKITKQTQPKDIMSAQQAMKGKPLLSRTMMIINRPEMIGLYCAGRIEFKEGLLLALALTFSNLVTGVGAGLIGLNLPATILAIFLFSIAAISIGMRIGCYTGHRWFGGLADPVAGTLLIMIGIYEIAF